jgi:hypothetical protein
MLNFKTSSPSQYTGSEAWTRSLGYNVEEAWRPWLIEDDTKDTQVAG